YGVEVSRDMLARAKTRFTTDIGTGRLRILEGSLTSLPLADASVDVAITANTIYFVPDLDAVCAELARVLRPQGRAVIAIGDPQDMAELPFTQHGFQLRPVEEITATLERAGLTVDHRTAEHRPISGHLLVARPTS